MKELVIHYEYDASSPFTSISLHHQRYQHRHRIIFSIYSSCIITTIRFIEMDSMKTQYLAYYDSTTNNQSCVRLMGCISLDDGLALHRHHQELKPRLGDPELELIRLLLSFCYLNDRRSSVLVPIRPHLYVQT